ncbi:hypothetical protein [Rhodanobacter hydrolyticus]|uniref:Uncharacterized protein n=1 Tax=Rhodanobacter hydrolyticus TaxID=2250595 RepID=A0ABW8JB37_9GAMM
MAVLLLLSLATPLQAASSGNPAGRYQAVTETEYSITLTLDSTGKARYEFVGWEADGSAPKQRKVLSGTWHHSGGLLSLQFPRGRFATYSIVPCLSYHEFGQPGCSAGLNLVHTNLADYYGLQRFGLWKSDSLSRNTNP